MRKITVRILFHGAIPLQAMLDAIAANFDISYSDDYIFIDDYFSFSFIPFSDISKYSPELRLKLLYNGNNEVEILTEISNDIVHICEQFCIVKDISVSSG